MNHKRGALEEAHFIVKPIEQPTITKRSFRVGGPCSSEKVAKAKQLFTPKGFRDWLTSDDAKGLVPEQVVECMGRTGVYHDDEAERVNLALESIIGARKAKAERVKKSTGGKKGKTIQIENAKAKQHQKRVLKTTKNAPRVNALEAFKRKNPEATLPEAARELVSRGLMGKSREPERAAKKWIRDHKAELPTFPPGVSGHPLGIPNSRKP